MRSAVEDHDVDALTVVIDLADDGRLAWLRDESITNLLPRLAVGDPYRLTGFLRELGRRGLLTRDRLGVAVGLHLRHHGLTDAPDGWHAVFTGVPSSALPSSFEVAEFLDRGRWAAELARTPAQRRSALRMCMTSNRADELAIALDLAQALEDDEVGLRTRARLTDALVAEDRADEAIAHFEALGRWDGIVRIHERAGRWEEALRACPHLHEAESVAQVERLADPVLDHVDTLVASSRFGEAAGLTAAFVAAAPTESPVHARARSALAAVRGESRRHWQALLRECEPRDRPALLLEYSAVEERAGDLAEAARLAADGGDRYRAARLFADAGRHGDARGVFDDDRSPEAAAARARASEAGGDLRGAAAELRRAGDLEGAAERYERAGDPAAAMRCWEDRLGPEVGGSAAYARCAVAAGRFAELAEACLTAIDHQGPTSPALGHLRILVRTRGRILDPDTAARARERLGEADEVDRSRFTAALPGLLGRARREVDRRFSDIWALDLGTSTSVVAVYDRETGEAVPCRHRGRDRFPSSFAVDRRGEELIGLDREEELADRVIAVIRGAKRSIGTRRRWRVRSRHLAPEDITARFVHHARRIVEGHLADQVRERVTALARAELGIEVPEGWLDDLAEEHPFRVDRTKVVITVPAFFHNNQKNATRDAGSIGGVEVVRLIHEPTAACLAVTQGHRDLGERVVVVDLGAGTLDLSALEIGDGLYEVGLVDGDTSFGGADLDAAVVETLVAQLDRQGVTIAASGRRRLEVAAERMKVRLSSESEVTEVLTAFSEGRDVTLALTRAELDDVLAGPLERLAKTCRRFRAEIDRRGWPANTTAVLVGGPFLAPASRAVAEQALGMRTVRVGDPTLAVARGAALYGAVRARDLTGIVLQDVVPLALGLRVKGEEQDGEFKPLIEAGARIPTEQSETFTTAVDDQDSVGIEVFQGGSLTAGAKVADFGLDGIRPAPQGVPQIKVTFKIDANCILTVTAEDLETGQSRSVSARDTTLLAPQERRRMQEAFVERRAREGRRSVMREVLARVEAALGDTEALLREWRLRRDAHRSNSAPTNPETAALLVDMFRSGREVDDELSTLDLRLRALTDRASGIVGTAIDETAEDDEAAVAADLRVGAERHRALQDTVAAWNSALIAARIPDDDPVAAFVRHHDADAPHRALTAWDRIDATSRSVALRRRHLDCLAAVGDRDGYDAALESLGGGDPDAVRDAIAVLVDHDGDVVALGVPVTPGLLVVGGDPGTGSAVRLAERRFPVERVARSRAGLAALPLNAAASVRPVRVGYPSLLQVGDRLVVVPVPGSPTVGAVVQGLDQRNGRTVARASFTRAVPDAALVLTTSGEVVGTLLPGPHERTEALVDTWGEVPQLVLDAQRDPWSW
ncbi:Hsp70 family protein [Actinomycetospora atypica]|uniref:Hsp70 family protein n=1 Tax=Actinomycetospora atypica TaxID=1290095 RepID=A0ABV9YFI3_9PSEU